MASTITAATLTVKLTEQIKLNGVEQGSSNTLTIGSVNEIFKRIITVPTSKTTIASLSTATAGSTFITGDVRYIRLTNLDNDNYVTLSFINQSSDEFAVKLDYGQSFIYNADLVGGGANTMDAVAATALTPTLHDLTTVTAKANSAACDLEVFIASA
tara:strand:+ start:207 stop:677 length:471 start_codon:yes stop_codon:yes gene_type:complete